jgi:nuclear pore complex protein Nup205
MSFPVDSMLIKTDIDGSGAVKKYYELLLAVMRVVNATVFSRGFENEQTIRQGRKFLLEHRLSILTVFKRSAKIGSLDRTVSDECVEELAEAYMLLISLTGYLDVCINQ